MIKKIKDYVELKRAKKSMMLLLLNKMSELIQKEIENKEIEKELLVQAKEMNQTFSKKETTELMDTLKNFMTTVGYDYETHKL